MAKVKAEPQKSDKPYTLRTYGIINGVLDDFEKVFEEVDKHARKNSLRPPSRGEIVTALMKTLKKGKPEDVIKLLSK